MKKIIIFLIAIIPLLFIFNDNNFAYAENLNDTISEQLTEIDLTELNDLISTNSDDFDFNFILKNIIKGKFDSDAKNVYSYILSLIGNNFKIEIKNFIFIISVIIFVSIINNIKSEKSESSKNIINLVAVLAIIIILSSTIIACIKKIKNTIEILTKLNEIMSPIILSLMIASGGNTSAGIYKPTVNILSNIILNNISIIIIPIVILIVIFSLLSNISPHISFNKYSELLKSVYKWIIGLTVAIFGIFITTQGIASNIYDGISFKITKYALSNSIPMIGGFLGGGIDFFIAGSTVIKNSIGLIGLFFILELLLSPIINMAIISLILKLISAIAETLNNKEISNVISSFGTGITLFNITLILSGVMTFITVLLLMISANFVF